MTYSQQCLAFISEHSSHMLPALPGVRDVRRPPANRHNTRRYHDTLLSLLPPVQDRGGWHESASGDWEELHGIVFAGACGPPGGGRARMSQRWTHHFAVLHMPEPPEEAVQHILKPILHGFLGTFFPPDIRDLLARSVAVATAEAHACISEELLPTPQQEQYRFSLHTVAQAVRVRLLFRLCARGCCSYCHPVPARLSIICTSCWFWFVARCRMLGIDIAGSLQHRTFTRTRAYHHTPTPCISAAQCCRWRSVAPPSLLLPGSPRFEETNRIHTQRSRGRCQTGSCPRIEGSSAGETMQETCCTRGHPQQIAACSSASPSAVQGFMGIRPEACGRDPAAVLTRLWLHELSRAYLHRCGAPQHARHVLDTLLRLARSRLGFRGGAEDVFGTAAQPLVFADFTKAGIPRAERAVDMVTGAPGSARSVQFFAVVAVTHELTATRT